MHIKPASRRTLNPNIFDIHKNNGGMWSFIFYNRKRVRLIVNRAGKEHQLLPKIKPEQGEGVNDAEVKDE